MDPRGSAQTDGERDNLRPYAHGGPPQPNASSAQEAPPPYIAHLRSPPRAFSVLPGTAALGPLPPLEAPSFRGGTGHFSGHVALRPIQGHPPPRPQQQPPQFVRDRPQSASYSSCLAPIPDTGPAPQPPQPSPHRSLTNSGTTGAPASSPHQGPGTSPKRALAPSAALEHSATGIPASGQQQTERPTRNNTTAASPKNGDPALGSTASGGASHSPPVATMPSLAPVSALMPASSHPPPLPPRGGIIESIESGSSRILQSVHNLQRMPHCPPLSEGIPHHRRQSPGPVLHPLAQPSGSRNRTPSPAGAMRMAATASTSMQVVRNSPVNHRSISPVMEGQLTGHERLDFRASRTVSALAYGDKSRESRPGQHDSLASGKNVAGSSEMPIDVDALPSDRSQSTSIRRGLPKSEPVPTQIAIASSAERASGKVAPSSVGSAYRVVQAERTLQQDHHQVQQHQVHAGVQRPLPNIASHLQRQELVQTSAPIHGLNSRSDGKDLQSSDSRLGQQQLYEMQRPHASLVPPSSSATLQHQQPSLQAAEYGARAPGNSGLGIAPFAQTSVHAVRAQGSSPDNAQRNSVAPIDVKNSSAGEEGTGDANGSSMLHRAYTGFSHAASGLPQHRAHEADVLDMMDRNQVQRQNNLGAASPFKQEPEAVGQKTTLLSTAQDQADLNSDPSGPRRGQLRVEDALAYLEQVKTQFGERVEVYNLFLDIMKAFKAQKIDTTEVIVRVSQLFLGHSSLILGFNRFLPPGYKIQITEDEETGALSTGFEGPGGYSSLSNKRNLNLKPIPQEQSPSKRRPGALPLSPRRKYGKSKHGSSSASDALMAPMEPEGPAAHSEAEGSPSSQGPVPNALSDRANAPSSAPIPGAASSSLPPKAVAQLGSRPSTAGPANFPMETIPGPHTSSEEEHNEGFQKALNFVHAVKARVSNPPDLFMRFMDIFSGFRNEQKTIREMYDAMAELFVDHKDLLQDFKEFLPMLHNGAAMNGNKGRGLSSSTPRRKPAGRRTTSTAGPLSFLGPGKPKDEFAIFEYIKEKLGPQNKHIYTDFIKCVMLFTVEILSKDELLVCTQDCFEHHPLLQDAFVQYMEAAANNDLIDGVNEFLSDDEYVEPADPETIQKYRDKPVSEIAGDSKLMGTKSYRGLPRNYPKLTCSGRTPLEQVTLNNKWVSVTQGSEEYSTKFMRKNSFEDNLYRCEDDRYELDMVIETNAATIMQLEPIALTMTKLPSEVKPMHALVEGVLNRIHYNAIQRIYGEQGQEVVMQVKLNPSVTIPVVLARLKEKDQHWRRARNEMNRIWRDVGEKNYYKGVDHRSAVYKAFDKKELSSKMLLLDILDPGASETLRETEMARARGYALPSGSGIVNDRSRAVRAVRNALRNSSPASHLMLEFEYKDDTVHRNAFDLIRMCMNKDNSDTAAAKFMTRTMKKLITAFYSVSFDDDEIGPKEVHAPAVLYGDESVYFMFRLYDYLYERLSLARVGAFQLAKDQAMRNEMNQKGKARVSGKSHIPALETTPSSLVQSFSPTATQKHFSVEKISTNGQELYDEFFKMFKAVLSGKEDALKFEDRCRVIIGSKCFVVFTLDKLVQKTVRQITAVCGADSISRPFFDLYQESRSRTRSAPANAGGSYWEGMEALYCTSAAAYLKRERGEHAKLFRMQFFRKRENNGLLVIHAFGKTTTEEDDKRRAEHRAELDEFVEFNASVDIPGSKHYNSHLSNRKGGSSARSDREADVSHGPASDVSAKNGANTGVLKASKRKHAISSSAQSSIPTRKRARTTFSGGARLFRKVNIAEARVVDKQFVMKNELELKINSGSKMVYVEGGMDVLLSRHRLWRRPDANSVNAASVRSQAVRKLLGLDDRSREEEKKSGVSEGEKMVDVEDTESSSGHTASDDDGSEKENTRLPGADDREESPGRSKLRMDTDDEEDVETGAGLPEKSDFTPATPIRGETTGTSSQADTAKDAVASKIEKIDESAGDGVVKSSKS